MARRAQGFTLRQHPKGLWYVRFTHQGRRHDLSTGTRDSVEALAEAKRIYADTVSGRRRQVVIATTQKVSLIDVGAMWLDAISSTLDKLTVDQYLMYVRAHFAPFFGTIDRVTDVSSENYSRHRLASVQRDTLLKELAALRGLLAWSVGAGYLTEAPKIVAPQRKATGTVVFDRKVTELSPTQVLAFLRAIRADTRFHSREYFAAMYHTGLRPATLQALRSPEHYKRGGESLRIVDAIDKSRFGRDVPLTKLARKALDAVCPSEGLLFGEHDHREQLRMACEKAKLPLFTPYDLRHARATHLVETSHNLAGVAYLLGHKRTDTTSSRYVHPSLRAAIDVLGKSK